MSWKIDKSLKWTSPWSEPNCHLLSFPRPHTIKTDLVAEPLTEYMYLISLSTIGVTAPSLKTVCLPFLFLQALPLFILLSLGLGRNTPPPALKKTLCALPLASAAPSWPIPSPAMSISAASARWVWPSISSLIWVSSLIMVFWWLVLISSVLRFAVCRSRSLAFSGPFRPVYGA